MELGHTVMEVRHHHWHPTPPLAPDPITGTRPHHWHPTPPLAPNPTTGTRPYHWHLTLPVLIHRAMANDSPVAKILNQLQQKKSKREFDTNWVKVYQLTRPPH